MNNPSPEVYEKAAEVLEERGWWRHGFVPGEAEEGEEDIDTCPVCVLAAINVALGYSPLAVIDPVTDGPNYEAALAFAGHLGLVEDLAVGHDVAFIVGDRWNDKQAESLEQVTGALRGFAKSLEASTR